jgi:hypothetical protein
MKTIDQKTIKISLLKELKKAARDLYACRKIHFQINVIKIQTVKLFLVFAACWSVGTSAIHAHELSRSENILFEEKMNHVKVARTSEKRSADSSSSSEYNPKRAAKTEAEMQISFLYGKNSHIQAYADCINKAKDQIIISSWNLNYIPHIIFKSLLSAKNRGVYISFIVNAVKKEEVLDYFEDDDDDEEDSTFDWCITKSHAKFLFVDSKSLILGSYNALGESLEETEDASFMIKGSIKQLWPFYMSIRETYIALGEDLSNIFGGIAAISSMRKPGERPLLERNFNDGSRIFLLRTIKEHEDFFKLATPHNGAVTIYSPFSTKDNTLKRLKTLDAILSFETPVHLKVLKRFENGLRRLLSLVPNLQRHAHIDVVSSHQKIVILGDQTMCVGSLNWLSAAQSATDPFSNVEFSLVLQGQKAAEIIQTYYPHTAV